MEQERAEAREAIEKATQGTWVMQEYFQSIIAENGSLSTVVASYVNKNDIPLLINSPTWLRNSLDREEQLKHELDHADAIAENWRREAFKKYPTPDAYDAACTALQKHRERADQAEVKAEQLIAENERLRWESRKWRRQLKKIRRSKGCSNNSSNTYLRGGAEGGRKANDK